MQKRLGKRGEQAQYPCMEMEARWQRGAEKVKHRMKRAGDEAEPGLNATDSCYNEVAELPQEVRRCDSPGHGREKQAKGWKVTVAKWINDLGHMVENTTGA